MARPGGSLRSRPGDPTRTLRLYPHVRCRQLRIRHARVQHRRQTRPAARLSAWQYHRRHRLETQHLQRPVPPRGGATRGHSSQCDAQRNHHPHPVRRTRACPNSTSKSARPMANGSPSWSNASASPAPTSSNPAATCPCAATSCPSPPSPWALPATSSPSSLTTKLTPSARKPSRTTNTSALTDPTGQAPSSLPTLPL